MLFFGAYGYVDEAATLYGLVEVSGHEEPPGQTFPAPVETGVAAAVTVTTEVMYDGMQVDMVMVESTGAGGAGGADVAGPEGFPDSVEALTGGLTVVQVYQCTETKSHEN